MSARPPASARPSPPRRGPQPAPAPAAPAAAAPLLEASARSSPRRPPGGLTDWDQPAVTSPRSLSELPLQNLKPTLCILSSGVYAGIEVVVDRALRIGRDAGNDLRLPGDVAMSRHHSLVTPTPDCLFIQDLGSTNGTYVNGVRVQRAPLNHNDRIRIGDTMLQVHYEQLPLGAGAAEPTPRAAPSHLGVELRTWRKQQGLTQAALSAKLGVSQRTVSLWEQGAPISAENQQKLREKAGCPLF